MALPPKIVIRSAQFVWKTLWKVMMQSIAPPDRFGNYVRPISTFRNVISPDQNHAFPAEIGRYCLYVGYSCPWAHRTLLVRSLKGLAEVIPIVIATPAADRGIWVLENKSENCATLPELYHRAQQGYAGRATVPVLWDSKTKTIVNNESAEIMVILNAAFNQFAKQPNLNLYPSELANSIDRWNAKIYSGVNNGVYRCGFAQSQLAYDTACAALFSTLEEIETYLATSRYLCGDSLTLTDLRLFTTLFRFDAVYFSLFKCDRRRIQDYANLGAYVRDIYQLPGVAETCRLADVQRDYFGNLFPLNPGGIVPSTPDMQTFLRPHDRGQKQFSVGQI